MGSCLSAGPVVVWSLQNSPIRPCARIYTSVLIVSSTMQTLCASGQLFRRILDQQVRLSPFFIHTMWFLTVNVDLLVLFWLGIYLIVCAVCYSPNLSIPAPIRDTLGTAMLAMRARLGLDSVHFAGGTSLENDLAIVQPVFNKLFGEPPLKPDFGSILVLITEFRAGSRVPVWLARRIGATPKPKTSLLNQHG